MELECWEASFQSNFENGSASESSTSRFSCDSSNPMMMSWQADKSGSQASLFGASGGLTQTAATPVRLCVCVCARSVCSQTRTRVRQWVLIGASLSEPHIDEFAVNFQYIYIYIYIYRTSCRKSLPALILCLSTYICLYVVP